MCRYKSRCLISTDTNMLRCIPVHEVSTLTLLMTTQIQRQTIAQLKSLNTTDTTANANINLGLLESNEQSLGTLSRVRKHVRCSLHLQLYSNLFSLVHHTNINKLTKSIHFIHYHVISANLYLHNTGFDGISIHPLIPNFYMYSNCYFVIQAWMIYDATSYNKEKYDTICQ